MEVEIDDDFLADLNACWKRNGFSEIKTGKDWTEAITTLLDLSMWDDFGSDWRKVRP